MKLKNNIMWVINSLCSQTMHIIVLIYYYDFGSMSYLAIQSKEPKTFTIVYTIIK